MGHDFALDSAYLHLTDEQLREHWKKAEADFEFLIDKRQIHEVESEVKALTEQNQRLTQKLENLESRTHILDDKDLEKRLVNSKFFQEMVTQAMQDALTEKTRK
jgi:molecular chaperone GrpE (heat shock protein)